MPSTAAVCLGIDAGGSYTDAVLFASDRGCIAKAKALTTRSDLSQGIANAVDKVLASAKIGVEQIELVSVSTTLATNVLVEGKIGRAGLVLIGFDESILKDQNLSAAIGSNPVIFCPGGHNGLGEEAAPLDLSPLQAQLDYLQRNAIGLAICGYFSVRNPEHELAAQRFLQDNSTLSVTMSHVLSPNLGAPKRAVTTLLNAGLVPNIHRLLNACTSYLTQRNIKAPLMLVRGDGSLVSAEFARANPIETILSGPAAGLVGAQYLGRLENAVVSDIGGTTTDITVIENGKPRLDPDGANVGGFRTMVQAVATSTFGIGGDSELGYQQHDKGVRLTIGPRRLIPLSLAATQHEQAIVQALQAQANKVRSDPNDGRFVMRTGLSTNAGLSSREQALLAQIGPTPLAIDTLIKNAMTRSTLRALVDRELVQICGFTPSDAAHVVGQQNTWNHQAAALGADLFARQLDRLGQPLASDGEAVSKATLAALAHVLIEAILQTALSVDNPDAANLVASPAFAYALKASPGLVSMRIGLNCPVLGLGASAKLHYQTLAKQLSCECIVPQDADVANAIGAVVGQISIQAVAYIQQPSMGVFRVSAGANTQDYPSLEQALTEAETQIRHYAVQRALEAGAAQPQVEVTKSINTVAMDGCQTFIDAKITASASGRPRLASQTV